MLVVVMLLVAGAVIAEFLRCVVGIVRMLFGRRGIRLGILTRVGDGMCTVGEIVQGMPWAFRWAVPGQLARLAELGLVDAEDVGGDLWRYEITPAGCMELEWL